MSVFVDPSWEPLLEYNGFVDLEQVWAHSTHWVEVPNNCRGGWSGVSRLALKEPAGNEIVVYLKRQQNHTRRTWRHPFAGEQTFTREFHVIRQLRSHGVGTPYPVLFGERLQVGTVQAMLMTAALTDYQPLDEIDVRDWPPVRRHKLLHAVACMVRRMHEAGVQHRSLYAKHLFIRASGDEFDVVIIDFEKSRHNPLPVLPAFFDLVTLNYRTNGWSRSSRMYFFKQYWGVGKLTRWQKWLCRLILRRSLKKKQENLINECNSSYVEPV